MRWRVLKNLYSCFFMVLLLGMFGIRLNEIGKGMQPEIAAQDTVSETIQREYEDAIVYVESNLVVEAPKIALTFDDGPSAKFTPRLLDGLKERNVKATFFLIGENARKNPDIVKRMSEEGHLVGNHTYHHVEITKVSDEKAYEEIMSTNDVIFEITGKQTEYMRPPFGLWQKKLEMNLDVFPVMWSIDPLDWTTGNVDEIVNKVVTQAQENDIILLHDCYGSSVEAALQIVDILQKEGFQFVTADELILD